MAKYELRFSDRATAELDERVRRAGFSSRINFIETAVAFYGEFVSRGLNDGDHIELRRGDRTICVLRYDINSRLPPPQIPGVVSLLEYKTRKRR